MYSANSENALIIGQGSIGKRHARLCEEAGMHVAVVSQYHSEWNSFTKIADALHETKPTLVIIASPTASHKDDLQTLSELGYTGRLLVEKPLFSHSEQTVESQFECAATAYNLRFHPVLTKLRKLIAEEKVLTVNAYVGQYLPDWRPDQDYRQTSSASISKGGGALRDLSHEIDYLQWLFGKWNGVFALGGKCSQLEIETDDKWHIIAQTDNGLTLNLELNCLDRICQRKIIMTTETKTILVDLVSNQLTVNEDIIKLPCERDETYRRQLNSIIENANASELCSLEEGLHVVKTIQAIESSNEQRKWIDL